jgi:toxin ParE1/3/4
MSVPRRPSPPPAPPSVTYEIRFHPAVRADLEAIARLIARAAGRAAAERRLAEIEAAVRSLAVTPHKGTIRDAIAPRLRAIPAGRRGVVAFTVDDDARCVRVHAITWAGGDWIGRTLRRRPE